MQNSNKIKKEEEEQFLHMIIVGSVRSRENKMGLSLSTFKMLKAFNEKYHLILNLKKFITTRLNKVGTGVAFPLLLTTSFFL